MARGIPLVIIGGIGQIFLGACASDCLGLQGAEALRHRWNWNKWGRNKSLDNDRRCLCGCNYQVNRFYPFIPRGGWIDGNELRHNYLETNNDITTHFYTLMTINV